ncbi:hypothetical protein L288_04995 [Sphingobium quisquiliarum P25]|uniref:Uncharacterized protein n=1 Tax=Sphingobium quisquiliarum P25 TaxID=1329909 RepID=T0HAD4_9SPHN|nr:MULTISPECIES: hypothetical protein [Sphingobium]EQB09977.1 hypothetical protein L288_04995 [Sphingobium quisquiliarum P25]EZP72685.1 hypothetical protein BV96_01316 [Sphingomonas paucimobilis]
MNLHPQIAALAAQMEDLSTFLRAQGDRLWPGRIDLCRHLVADSNFAGVDRFLRLFEGEDGLGGVTLGDPGAMAELERLRKAALSLAQRLAKEEGAD